MTAQVYSSIRFKITGLLVLLFSLMSCSEAYEEKFAEEMKAGNLSAAQEYLTKIDNRAVCEDCAKQLIKVYLDVDASSKAVDVYENITSWHASRSELDLHGSKYEKEVCKLLCDYFMQNGEYDKAYTYYPITYSTENYIGNAQDYFSYLSDVVASLCIKGKQEEARKFIEYKLRWFVINVDSHISIDEDDIQIHYCPIKVG